MDAAQTRTLIFWKKCMNFVCCDVLLHHKYQSYLMQFYELLLFCALLPDNFDIIFFHGGHSWRSKQQVTQTIQITAHFTIHRLLSHQRHNRAFSTATNGARKVQVSCTQTTWLRNSNRYITQHDKTCTKLTGITKFFNGGTCASSWSIHSSSFLVKVGENWPKLHVIIMYVPLSQQLHLCIS